MPAPSIGKSIKLRDLMYPFGGKCQVPGRQKGCFDDKVPYGKVRYYMTAGPVMLLATQRSGPLASRSGSDSFSQEKGPPAL